MEIEKLILSYCEKKGYTKTNKNLSKKIDVTTIVSTELGKFEKYIKKGKARKQLVAEKPKKPARKRVKSEKKKDEITQEFVDMISGLGLNKEDTDMLFGVRIDWSTITPESRVYCTDRKCNYGATIGSMSLDEHCRSKHAWGTFECPRSSCGRKLYSKMSLRTHARAHTSADAENDIKCTFEDCQASFINNNLLHNHLNIHNDVKISCVFCPYNCTRNVDINKHIMTHMVVKPDANLNKTTDTLVSVENTSVCPHCGKLAKSKTGLKLHISAKHKETTLNETI